MASVAAGSLSASAFAVVSKTSSSWLQSLDFFLDFIAESKGSCLQWLHMEQKMEFSENVLPQHNYKSLISMASSRRAWSQTRNRKGGVTFMWSAIRNKNTQRSFMIAAGADKKSDISFFKDQWGGMNENFGSNLNSISPNNELSCIWILLARVKITG